MQTAKEYVKHDLLRAAEELFFRKGYLGVSMREVATRSGVGLSNIYNYFSSKDELFRRVASPATTGIETMLERHHGRSGHDILDMFSDEYGREVVREYTDFICRNRRALTILLLRAEGSSLAGYKENFIKHATLTVREYFDEMKRRHPGIRTDISDFSIQVHTVCIFSMFEEIITRDIGVEDIPKVVNEYITIEISGWRKLMKI